MSMMRKKGFLNPKECWKVWVAPGGSLGKVRELYKSSGRINPRTGEAPYPSGIRKQAYVWVVGNKTTPDIVAEARKDFAYKKFTEEAYVVTDDDWSRAMVEMARVVFVKAPRQFDRFVVRHNLQKYI